MTHFKKDKTLDMRYKTSQFHVGLTGDYEGNLFENNILSSSTNKSDRNGFSYQPTDSNSYSNQNLSNSLQQSAASLNNRSSAYRSVSNRRNVSYRSRQLPIDSEGNVSFDFMSANPHNSDYYPTAVSYQIQRDDDHNDNNPFTKSSGPSTFSNNSKSFSIGPSSLSSKSRTSFKLRTNSTSANQPDYQSQQGRKVTLTQRSISDGFVSSNSKFFEPELLTDYEIKLNNDGTVNRNSRAVKNGDIYFKNDGSIDRRCNACKKGKIILDSKDQIDRLRMNIKLKDDQSSSNLAFSQNEPFSSFETASLSKSPYSVKPKEIKLKPPAQSFNSQNYDASKLRQSPFESDDDDDEYSEELFEKNTKSTNEKQKLNLTETKSNETIEDKSFIKHKKTLSKPFYRKGRRTKSSAAVINYSNIISKVSRNTFKNNKDREYSDDDDNDDVDDSKQNVKTREASVYDEKEEKNSKETETENKNENNKSKGFKLDTTFIYLIAIICLFILYFVVLSFIPISNERNYLIKCPKNAICDVKIDGNNSIKYTINRCQEKFVKLENGFIQICAPNQRPEIDQYLDTLKAASYISQISGNCLFQNKKIDNFHITELFPKADVFLLKLDEDFLTYFNGDEYKSNVPQYNLMCRIYKNSFELMPLQTLLIVAILITALFITSKSSLFDNE